MSDGLLELVDERLDGEEAAAVNAFARAYLRRLGASAGSEIPDDALYAEVLGAFRFASARGRAPAAVRALNPSVEDDGYSTHGSVLETNTPDLPFLVDSVTAALRAEGLVLRRVLHPIIGTERGPDGRITAVLHPREATARESVMHFEVDRRLDPERLSALEDTVHRVLRDVQQAVGSEAALRERVRAMRALAREQASHHDDDEVRETEAFLDWLADGAFLFLGARDDEVVDGTLRPVPGSGMGLLHDASGPRRPAPVADGELLRVDKTRRLSTVKRRTRMDAVAVRRHAEDGSVVGEAMLVGLFTSRAYVEPASQTPILHRKLRRILSAEDLIEGSHDYKAAVALFDSFPKDELFAAPVEDLGRALRGLLALQGDEVRVLGRRSEDGRTVSLIAAVPRRSHSAALVERLRALLADRCPSAAIDVHEALLEGDRAQVHYTLHATDDPLPEVPVEVIERELVGLARTWDDRLRERLVEAHGEERGRMLAARWAPRLPGYYKAGVDPELAVHHVAHFQQLQTSGDEFAVGLQHEPADLGERGASRTRVGLYKLGGKLELSRAMPILEDLGLRVIEEVPTRLATSTGQELWLQDFGVVGPDGEALDLAAVGDRVADAIGAVWAGHAESDALNQLVVTAGLDWRQVGILRAYRKYRQRIGSRFTESYQNEVILGNGELTARLMALFEQRFDPAREGDEDAERALREEIAERLDDVTSLDHDRVLRNQLGLIEATVRTNAYKPDRRALAFKVRSGEVPAMPQPAPLYEIFVYSPDVEGVHLRGGLIARGGLRWSDRMDYRTEVFGLMRAQMTKNAVIVPEGAKGGFYVRHRPSDPEALREEVERCYVAYIGALLDLTDNREGDRVVHPPGVRVRDGDDAYLVVAADKGTATFSDTANGVARRYGFWLGDAFASGGSAGYDHKALGITARGAWESLKRHFRELGRDPERDEFTAVGIGDMSGDVFGNGMLLSRTIRLVAAYDHRHVFLDPDPDPERSYAERRRLFETPRSSWDDYDREALSEGGGVYPRSAKRIEISEQARAALGIEDRVLAPADLIRAILRAPVDVLWNGGIGTVIKASTESHEDAHDRGSDAIRVDAGELRCRVVAEGGNLGLTQRARIEFSAAGGRVNADFVDNSAGVNCSDHEVNLKVLLQLAVQRGELDERARDALLREVTDDVVEHVLYGSFQQAQIISEEEQTSATRLWAYDDLMHALEEDGVLLRREVEALPGGEELAERSREGRGLERPEIAVLVALAKRSLTQALLGSALVDDPHFERDLREYFPPAVVERFGHLIPEHPLRRELAATLIANQVVDAMGSTFVTRLTAELGARPEEVVRAWRIAVEATRAHPRWEAIEALGIRVPTATLAELMTGVEWLVEVVTRHYLGTSDLPADTSEAVERGREGFGRLDEILSELGTDAWRQAHERCVAPLIERGVPEDLARRHAFQPAMVHAPDAIAVAEACERPVQDVARAFFVVEERAELGWLEKRNEAAPINGRMQRWAQQALRDDVLRVRRDLVQTALSEAGDVPVPEAIDRFFAARQERCRRLQRFVRALAQEGATDLAGLTLALRQVRALVDAD